MPALTAQELVSAIIDAIQVSGASAILTSTARDNPRRFALAKQDGADSLWIYAWTLTPGGRPQLPYEYRIQMTTVRSPLKLNPNGPTILLGYEPDLQMFAGFDLSRHRRFTTGSPSVQIDIRMLRKALQDGFGFDRKGTAEIAVAFRPDQFLNYTYAAEYLHRHGRNSTTFRLLETAASLRRIPQQKIKILGGERKRLIQTVSRFARNGRFRQQVLDAYGHRCAVTRMQLRLVEAAHILPVGAPGSVDVVENGIALSPTYHRAYDNQLIFLDNNYIMRINPAKENLLKQINLSRGIKSFTAFLGKIHLPQDRRQWPDPAFVRKANRFRLI